MAARNKSRPRSLGCTWICLCAALKSKLAPTKDECVSSGRKARRTSEAIGRLMRSGIAHLGSLHTQCCLRLGAGLCPPHDVELPDCYAFRPMPSGLFDGHAGTNYPSVCDFCFQQCGHWFRFSGFSVADALGKFTRQVCLGFWRPLRGNSDTAPVGTPSASSGASLRSGSLGPRGPEFLG